MILFSRSYRRLSQSQRPILPFCRSFFEISNCTLSKKQAEDAIGAMMAAAGFHHKETITWEDFHFLLRDHEKELQFAHLNVKGSPVDLCRGQLNCFPSVFNCLEPGN